MDKPIKYVAELSGVTEVTLIGSADLNYWHERLGKFGLVPLVSKGRAEIHVIAAEARFKGMPFREISFSVALEPTPGWHDLPNAACLMRAFNSNRFFAWCERFFFSTPYYPAKCVISAEPVHFSVANAQSTIFSAELHGQSDRQVLATGNHESYGTVAMLPKSSDPCDAFKYFVARLSGEARVYAFDQTRDLVNITKDNGDQLFEELLNSGFAGERWLIRAAANHAKSKTYKVK